MSLTELVGTACNIARSLSVVGDRWSLRILHEMSAGANRFEVLQARTQMSSHLLSGRLKKLEEDGILQRKVYCSRPVRYEYFATPKGKDLDDVLLALMRWRAHWLVSSRLEAEGDKLKPKRPPVFEGPSWNANEGELFSFDNCILVEGPKWKAERAANVEHFYASKHLYKTGSSATASTQEIH